MSTRRRKGADADLPSLFDDSFWDAPATGEAPTLEEVAAAVDADLAAEAAATDAPAGEQDGAGDAATTGAPAAPGTGPAAGRPAPVRHRPRGGRSGTASERTDATGVPTAGRLRTRGRARALQALYAADLRADADLRRVAVQVWDDLGVKPQERELASRLVERVHTERTEIDAGLTAVTRNWRLERLGAIERSVLRLAAAELRGEYAPPRVVLQEAVRLAERYGTPRSARFVNGVLDAYARSLGRL